jgi:AraC-like DNA-binding protein
MGRPSKEPPSPSPLVPALLRYVRARGGDATRIAARFGLAAEVEGNDEASVTALTWSELLEAAAEALGEPFLALGLPRELPLRRYGLAELVARASATLRDALVAMARYAPLIHPGLACDLDEQAGEAIVRQRTPGRPRGLGRHAHEYALAYVVTQARLACGEELAPSRVWFIHARPPDLAPLHRFFATRDLAFGHGDSGLALPRASLDLPVRGGDARLLATATDLADAALRAQPRGRELLPLVAARIEALLPGEVSMDLVARALHMSARTLQRRLEEEGTRFSEVVDDVREKSARRLAADPALSLAEVAYRLGFADLATFSRAFKRWTGVPPGTWRRGL